MRVGAGWFVGCFTESEDDALLGKLWRKNWLLEFSVGSKMTFVHPKEVVIY
jgi:hypothetical protein